MSFTTYIETSVTFIVFSVAYCITKQYAQRQKISSLFLETPPKSAEWWTVSVMLVCWRQGFLWKHWRSSFRRPGHVICFKQWRLNPNPNKIVVKCCIVNHTIKGIHREPITLDRTLSFKQHLQNIAVILRTRKISWNVAMLCRRTGTLCSWMLRPCAA